VAGVDAGRARIRGARRAGDPHHRLRARSAAAATSTIAGLLRRSGDSERSQVKIRVRRRGGATVV
jgi:hypothetical protein